MSTDNKSSMLKVQATAAIAALLAAIIALITDVVQEQRFLPNGMPLINILVACGGVILVLVILMVFKQLKKELSWQIEMGICALMVFTCSSIGSMVHKTFEEDQIVWIAGPYGEEPEVLEQEVLFARPNAERHEFVMRQQTVRAGGELETADRLHLYTEVEVTVTFSPNRFNYLAFAALRSQANASPDEVRLNDAIAKEVADSLWAAFRQAGAELTEEELHDVVLTERVVGGYFRDYSWNSFRRAGFGWDGIIRIVALHSVTPLG